MRMTDSVECRTVDISGKCENVGPYPTEQMIGQERRELSNALCFIEVSSEACHLILTYSLSSLLALRTFCPNYPFVQDTLTRLTSLEQSRKSIQFRWIPCHVGVAGNELAEAAARHGTSVPCTRRLPLLARDFYPAVNRPLRPC